MKNRNRSWIIVVLTFALLAATVYAAYISSINVQTSWTVRLGGNLHLYDSSMLETTTIDFGEVPYHSSVVWDGYISFEGNNGDCGLEIVLPVDDAYLFSANYVGASIGATPIGLSVTLFDINMQYGTPYSGVIVFEAIALVP